MKPLTRRAFLGGACVLCAAVGAGAGRLLGPDTDRAADLRGGAAPKLVAHSSGSGSDFRGDGEGVFRVETDEPLVALTLDDGPDPRFTPTVLDVLAAHKVNATFFLVGVNAKAQPELVARQVGAGHTIGNHTYDHADLETLPAPLVQEEIELGSAAIAGAGAPLPIWFRPPKGHTDEVVDVIADAQRYRTVFWDLCVERFVHHAGVPVGVERLVRRARPGSIILAHDGGHVLAPRHPVLDRSSTVAALPLLLDGLARKGLRVVDLPTLLAARR